jgi:hypothetical protein
MYKYFFKLVRRSAGAVGGGALYDDADAEYDVFGDDDDDDDDRRVKRNQNIHCIETMQTTK